MNTMKKRIAVLVAAAAFAGAGLWAGAIVNAADTSRYEISIKGQRLSVEHSTQTLRDLIIPT